MKSVHDIRIDKKLVEELNEIRKQKLKNGTALNYWLSYRRLTKAIRRHPLWNDIKEDIIKSELEDDRFKSE